MDFVNLPLLAAAALVFASVLAGLYSARIGFSFLLVFLVAGILAGEDGIGGYRFDDFRLSFWVGNLALAVILLDGGLRTAYATFRTGLRPASVLATLGVVICAGITALAGVAFLGLDWGTALLLGAIVGSTDAAAVFALLTRSGVTLNERVAATLEIESGVNDPMAVYLTLAFIGLAGAAAAPASSAASVASTMAIAFAQQFGWGALLGVASGFTMAALLRRVASRDAGGGILALLIGAGGLSVFAATGLLGGSGFLAVYLFGLIVANRAAEAVAPTLAAMDGYAWLAQAGMFLLLGLLVTPSSALPTLGRRGGGRGAGLRRPAAGGLAVPAAVPLLGARDLVHRLGRPARRGADRAGAVPAAGRHPAGDAAVQRRLRRRAGVAAGAGHDDRPGGPCAGRGDARPAGRTRDARGVPRLRARSGDAGRRGLRVLRPAGARRCVAGAGRLDGRRAAPPAGGRRPGAAGPATLVVRQLTDGRITASASACRLRHSAGAAVVQFRP